MNSVAKLAEHCVSAALQSFPTDVVVKDDGQCRRVGIFGVTLEVNCAACKVLLVREPLDQIVLNWGLSDEKREELFDLRSPFSLSSVLDLFHEHLQRESALLTADNYDLSGASVHPAACEFNRRSLHALAEVLDLQRINQQVFRELELDERIMRATDLASSDFPAGSHVYNKIWSGWKCYGVVLDDAPNLMALVYSAVVNGHITGEREILHELKDALRRAGLSKCGWKRLCELPRGIVAHLVPAFELEEFFECFVNACSNFAIVESEGPDGFANLLLRHQASCLHDLSPHAIRLLASQAHFHAARGRLLELFDNELRLVCDYLRERLPGPATLRKMDWTQLVSAAQRYKEEDEEEIELSLPESDLSVRLASWDTALGEHREAGLQFIPLTTPAALAEEGKAMRHCVGGYAGDCMIGKSRIFSIRSLRTRRRVATVQLRVDDLKRPGEWIVGQIKGPSNSEVVERVRRAAEELARRYTAEFLASRKRRARH